MKEKLIKQMDFNFEVKLDDETLGAFVALSGDVNFIKFREKINDLLIMRAIDFMKGAPVSEGVSNAQDYYRGMGSFWKAALRLVDGSEATINQREIDKKEKSDK